MDRRPARQGSRGDVFGLLSADARSVSVARKSNLICRLESMSQSEAVFPKLSDLSRSPQGLKMYLRMGRRCEYKVWVVEAAERRSVESRTHLPASLRPHCVIDNATRFILRGTARRVIRTEALACSVRLQSQTPLAERVTSDRPHFQSLYGACCR